MIKGALPLCIDTFAAEADYLAVDQIPLLTRPAVAANDDYLRSFRRHTALDIQTHAVEPGNLASADDPLLIRTAMTMEQRRRRSIECIAVRKIDALARVNDAELRCVALNAVATPDTDDDP